MAEIKIDPIIMGHNQFYGTDHLDASRGSQRAAHFSEIKNVIDVIRWSVEEGATGLMLSTHDHATPIINALKKDKDLCSKLNFYPNIPYIAKYVRQSNEKGLVPMLIDILKGADLGQKFKILFKGGTGVLGKDVTKLLGVLIDMEMLIFKDLPVKAIFLHNVLVDLALGIKSKRVFEFYYEYVNKNYKCIPAFATANMPLLAETLNGWGYKNPLIMTAFNKSGYCMNPDLKSNEDYLKNNNVRLLAMATLASGYLKPKEAFEYLYSLPNIESVVVGASSHTHIKETFGIIKSHLS